jgi:hypothetical protein
MQDNENYLETIPRCVRRKFVKKKKRIFQNISALRAPPQNGVEFFEL